MVKVAAAWLMGLVAAVVVAIVTISLVNTNVYGPEEQVNSYFEALQDGDGGGALGLLNASVPDANAAMLDGPALEESASALQDIAVGEPEETGDGRVDVPVSYTIKDTAHNTTFALEKSGTHWLFFDRWEFVPSVLPTVEVSIVNRNEATLNGTRVALPDGQSSFAVFYPGGYEAHYTGEFLAAPEEALAVPDPQGPYGITLATEATDTLVAAVDEQVRDFLDECAAQAVFQPANCPFNFQTESRLAGEIDWSITEYPGITIEPDDGGWTLAPLTGTAELQTSLQDLFTGSIESITVSEDFDFTARLAVSGSEVIVTPVIEY